MGQARARSIDFIRKRKVQSFVDGRLPKGQLLLPEKDRQRTLNALKEKRDDLIREIEYLPLVIELQSLKRKKARLEKELEETEAGIELFSRSKVYVPKEEFENFTIQRSSDC
jgi:Calmodulin-binding